MIWLDHEKIYTCTIINIACKINFFRIFISSECLMPCKTDLSLEKFRDSSRTSNHVAKYLTIELLFNTFIFLFLIQLM